MSTQRPMTIIAVIALCTLLPSSAQADLVTFGVTGYVTIFEGHASVGWSVPMGTPFYGTFTFDTTVPDSHPNDPTLGRYINTISLSSFWLGSDWVAEAEHNGILDSDIRVTNDRDGFDTYTVIERAVAFRGYDVDVGIFLQDYTHTAFDDDSLPVVPPSLEAFWYNHWQIGADSPGYEFVAAGPITSLTRMPEPTTALLLLGGSMLALRRNRR